MWHNWLTQHKKQQGRMNDIDADLAIAIKGKQLVTLLESF